MRLSAGEADLGRRPSEGESAYPRVKASPVTPRLQARRDARHSVRVTVAVVDVGIVRMLVPQRLMMMPMRVGFPRRIARIVRVLVVRVVDMTVLVFHRLMRMLMIMRLHKMKV